MSDVISQYNGAYAFLVAKGIDNCTFKGMLLNASGTFNPAHATIDSVAGAVSGGHRPNEVYGNGWTEGGEVLDTIAVAVWNTNGFSIDAADERHTATGGPIGPYNNVVIYEVASGRPIWHISNGGTGAAKTAGESTDNAVVFDAGGILRASL